MKPTTALMEARWHQTRGSAKETWGKISKHPRTTLEGQMEQLSGQSQETLLRAQAQARKEIEDAVQRGQQNIQQLNASLVSTANRVLGRPKKRTTSRIWIPALGAALLTGLGLAILTYKTDLLAGLDTSRLRIPSH